MTVWGNVILPQKDGFIYGTAEPTVSGLWFKSDGADVPVDPDVGNGLFYYRDNDGQLHPMYPMTRMDAVYGLGVKLGEMENAHNSLSNTVSGMISSAIIEIPLDAWNENQAVVDVPGVDLADTVMVSPEPGDGFEEYANCGVRCVSQGAGSLTFRCQTVPDRALTVNVAVWRATE